MDNLEMTDKNRSIPPPSLFDYSTFIGGFGLPFLILFLLYRGFLSLDLNLKTPISLAFVFSLFTLYIINDICRKLAPQNIREMNPIVRFFEKFLPWWLFGFLSSLIFFIFLPLFLILQSHHPSPLTFLTDFLYFFAFLFLPSVFVVLTHDSHTLYKIKTKGRR